MVAILKGPALHGRLAFLASRSEGIDIAVAWATECKGLMSVLSAARSRGKSCVRIIVGVSDYFTSPEALKKMAQFTDLRIHGTPSGLPLFHPKLYVFHLPENPICWVGSANLTKKAFGENVEAVAEFTDTNGGAEEHFQTLWDSDNLTCAAQFDLAGYEKEWNKRRDAWPPQRPALSEDDEVTTNGPGNKISPLSGWAEYVSRLRQTGADLFEAIQTLDAGAEFVSRDWACDLSKREKYIMFGHSLDGEDFGLFGKLRIHYAEKFCGSSPKSKKRREQLGEILRQANTAKVFHPEMARKFFEGLIEIDGCGPALATRLLVLARPDWFIVVNKKSFQGLTKEFNIPVKKDIKPAKYAELVQRIQQQPWWNVDQPSDPAEAEFWKYRAALIDRLVYRETNDEFAED